MYFSKTFPILFLFLISLIESCKEKKKQNIEIKNNIENNIEKFVEIDEYYITDNAKSSLKRKMIIDKNMDLSYDKLILNLGKSSNLNFFSEELKNYYISNNPSLFVITKSMKLINIETKNFVTNSCYPLVFDTKSKLMFNVLGPSDKPPENDFIKKFEIDTLSLNICVDQIGLITKISYFDEIDNKQDPTIEFLFFSNSNLGLNLSSFNFFRKKSLIEDAPSSLTEDMKIMRTNILINHNKNILSNQDYKKMIENLNDFFDPKKTEKESSKEWIDQNIVNFNVQDLIQMMEYYAVKGNNNSTLFLEKAILEKSKKGHFIEAAGAFTDDGVQAISEALKKNNTALKEIDVHATTLDKIKKSVDESKKNQVGLIVNEGGNIHRSMIYVDKIKKEIIVMESLGQVDHSILSQIKKDFPDFKIGKGGLFSRQVDYVNCSIFSVLDLLTVAKAKTSSSEIDFMSGGLTPANFLIYAQSISKLKKIQDIGEFLEKNKNEDLKSLQDLFQKKFFEKLDQDIKSIDVEVQKKFSELKEAGLKPDNDKDFLDLMKKQVMLLKEKEFIKAYYEDLDKLLNNENYRSLMFLTSEDDGVKSAVDKIGVDGINTTLMMNRARLISQVVTGE